VTALVTLLQEFENGPSGLRGDLVDGSGGVYEPAVRHLALVLGVQSPLSAHFFRRYFLLARKNDLVWGIQNQYQIRLGHKRA
jgi:hypothetical protein